MSIEIQSSPCCSVFIYDADCLPCEATGTNNKGEVCLDCDGNGYQLNTVECPKCHRQYDAETMEERF